MPLHPLFLAALLCAWSCAALGQVQPVQGIGTAGSPAGGVLTVQPPAGGTAPDTKVDQGAAAAITGGWPVTDGAGTDTTGTLTSGAGSVIAQIDGYSSAKIQIKGTYAAFTASVLVSSDGGTTTVPLQCAMIDGSQFGSSFNLAANQSAEISCGHQSGDDTLILSTSAGPATGTANVDISPASFPSIDGSTVKAMQPIPAVVVTGQAVIAVTNTAVQLGSNALLNGLVIKAKSTNSASCGTVGKSGTTNTYDGTGNGYGLCPGEASSFAIPNSNLIFVNGTVGDIFTFEGN